MTTHAGPHLGDHWCTEDVGPGGLDASPEARRIIEAYGTIGHAIAAALELGAGWTSSPFMHRLQTDQGFGMALHNLLVVGLELGYQLGREPLRGLAAPHTINGQPCPCYAHDTAAYVLAREDGS